MEKNDSILLVSRTVKIVMTDSSGSFGVKNYRLALHTTKPPQYTRDLCLSLGLFEIYTSANSLHIG